MQTMIFSEAVKFKPWIDETNFGQDRLRILFVGESHYTNHRQASNRELTRDVVRLVKDDKLGRKNGRRFFTNIVAMSMGELPSSIEAKSEWWSGVAFYNYIQTPVGNKPRTRLKLSKFTDSHEAFHEVLSVIQPDIVVILGRRTWKNMSERDAVKVEPLKVATGDPVYRELWSYKTVEGKSALVFHTKHPSAGFNYQNFYPLLNELISRIEAKR